MTEARFTSNTVYPKLMRGVLILFAGMSACLVVLGATQSVQNAILPTAMFVLCVFLFVKSRGKFGVVSVSEAGLTIVQAGATFAVEWRDAVSLREISGVSPPLYRVTLRKPPFTTYFVPRAEVTISQYNWAKSAQAMAEYMQERMSGSGSTDAI